MGFLARLFGKRDQAVEPASEEAARATGEHADSAAEEPRELRRAIDALQAGDLAAAMAYAKPYLHDRNALVRTDALRLLALASSHQGKYQDALPFWTGLVELEPSAHNWAQLAATAAATGKLEIAEPAFARAIELSAEGPEGGRSAMPMLHGNYASALDLGGNSALALRHLDILKSWHSALGITDATFLYIRGMPLFEVFLEHSLPIVKKVKAPDEVVAWLKELEANVDEDGQRLVAAYRSAMMERA
jgi:tetratricopeptide (TPR) repeat protein